MRRTVLGLLLLVSSSFSCYPQKASVTTDYSSTAVSPAVSFLPPGEKRPPEKNTTTFASTSRGVEKGIENSTAQEFTSLITSPAVYNTGVLSVEEYRQMRVVQGWMYLSLESLAIVLMVPSAVAFLQDSPLSPHSVYLAATCLSQTWYMAILFSHYLCKLSEECFASKRYVQASIWLVSYSAMAARRCAYMFNALMSFQRYIAVAFPLKFRQSWVLRKPLYPLVCATLLSLLLHLYRPLRYKPVQISDDKDNAWTQGFSTLYKNHRPVFKSLEEATVYLTMYLPMLVCLISNCLMLLSMRKHKKNVNNLQSSQAAIFTRSQVERQITVTILGSTFLMLILNTPVNINEVVTVYLPHYGILKKEYYLYMVLRSCFAIISHTCDILVVLTYLLLSASFRKRFVALFSGAPCRTFAASDSRLSQS